MFDDGTIYDSTPNDPPPKKLRVDMLIPPQAKIKYPYDLVTQACYWLCSAAYSYDSTLPHPQHLYENAIKAVFGELPDPDRPNNARAVTAEELAAIISSCASTAVDAVITMRGRFIPADDTPSNDQ